MQHYMEGCGLIHTNAASILLKSILGWHTGGGGKEVVSDKLKSGVGRLHEKVEQVAMVRAVALFQLSVF